MPLCHRVPWWVDHIIPMRQSLSCGEHVRPYNCSTNQLLRSTDLQGGVNGEHEADVIETRGKNREDEGFVVNRITGSPFCNCLSLFDSFSSHNHSNFDIRIWKKNLALCDLSRLEATNMPAFDQLYTESKLRSHTGFRKEDGCELVERSIQVRMRTEKITSFCFPICLSLRGQRHANEVKRLIWFMVPFPHVSWVCCFSIICNEKFFPRGTRLYSLTKKSVCFCSALSWVYCLDALKKIGNDC